MIEVVALTCESFPKSIALDITLPDVPLLVEGDATHLNQVLVNPMVNARDAMPGEITHAAPEQFKETPEGIGKRVVVTVSDTGMG